MRMAPETVKHNHHPMATVSESPEDSPNPNSPAPTPLPPPSDYPSKSESKVLEQATPWIDYAVEQALLYQKIIEQNINATIEASRSRLSEFGSTSAAHFNQTIDSLEDVKSQLAVYENMMFGKVKEGIKIAASHPMITGGIAVGLGVLVLKRPRRFLYYNTLRLFVSEESWLSKADIRVKELRQSIDRLKTESVKLERSASVAEEDLIRGRKKLRHAGKQIQSVIHSAYKIERQAAGLKDILGELPSREASRFRSQVSFLNISMQALCLKIYIASAIMKLQCSFIPIPVIA
ncbi:Uncharacterized protein TCM_005612 isoform 3 [Theobroma cacao]|uniref:Uncharacterized protein isoform 3 n=1 Tax=Theobroma cacao TaxID=3641 RepID=A0A061DVB8_THECC|nr:Uncharacterized protein TCM_005612 isoform 3 [Theobroma cacao]